MFRAADRHFSHSVLRVLRQTPKRIQVQQKPEHHIHGDFAAMLFAGFCNHRVSDERDSTHLEALARTPGVPGKLKVY